MNAAILIDVVLSVFEQPKTLFWERLRQHTEAHTSHKPILTIAN